MSLPGINDWVRCTLPSVTRCYGAYARVTAIRENGRGIMVAFPPQQEGWKPHRIPLLHENYVKLDTVSLLGRLVS